MKRTVYAAIAVSLMVLFVAACEQYKQEAKQSDEQKQAQITEMMQDSSMVNMMMDHIASDYHLQRMMMQKMIQRAKSDRTAMTQIGKMMADDQEIRGSLMKLQNEQKMNGYGTTQEILIKFNPDVQQAQVSALESEVGLEQTKVIPALNVRVFKITSSKSVKEIIAICEKKPFVKYAEPNYQYKALKN